MTTITIEEAVKLAAQHYQSNQFAEAEQICRQVLSQQPNSAPALHVLGLIAHRTGNSGDAVGFISKAILADPSVAEMHNNLGEVWRAVRQFDKAMSCFNEALRLNPGFALAYNNMGSALAAVGRIEEANVVFRKAIDLMPEFPMAYNNLGNLLAFQGVYSSAAACFRRAIELDPKYAEAYANLGNSVKELGHIDLAVDCLRKAIELQPNDARSYNILGILFEYQRNFEQSLMCFRHAVSLDPNFAEAHNNLAASLREHGKVEEAIVCLKRALEIEPRYISAHDNLLLTLPYSPNYSAAAIFAEHQVWEKLHAESLYSLIRPHTNDRSPERRLRIGYLSAYFIDNVIGLYLDPVFAAHDRSKFEIFCYSDARNTDAATTKIKGHVDVWRDSANMSPDQLADMIRNDKIDILVDLMLHMDQNRMTLFARKPAPIQATYLAYPSTSGMRVMDYKITDVYLDPPGMTEKYHTEKLLRLPDTYWCYAPIEGSPAVNALPCAAPGAPVTFCSLNNLSKVNIEVWHLWRKILDAVPGSRLAVLSGWEGRGTAHARELAAQAGIADDRLEIIQRQKRPEYFKLYSRVDITLDPFPCGGHTTSLDSLWMGVPVVALEGDNAMARAAVSLLSNVGMTDLLARTPEEYVDIAVKLATDKTRLAEIRRTLRQRMADSPLMNVERFTHHLEDAYRQMWRTWCAR